MAFDDLLGPRKQVLDTPVERVNEKNAMPPDGELNLNDLLGDDEADDQNGNTVGDPWANVPVVDPADGHVCDKDCDPDDCDCDSGGCGC